jgi:hypothetical protein
MMHHHHGVSPSTGKKAERILGLSLFPTVAAVLLLFETSGLRLPPCRFREITGIPCLTCGLTRSLAAALHLRFAASFEYHLMGPVILGLSLLLFLKSSIETAAGRKILKMPDAKAVRNAGIGFAALWLCFGIVRGIRALG